MQHDGEVDQVAAVHAELVQLARELVAGGRDAQGGPSFAQHSVLSFVARNPGCRATDISDAFGVNRSTVSRQLRGCTDGGWVRADSAPVRSGRPLYLTAQGVAVLAAADRRRFDDVRARVDGWSPTEIAQFAQILRRFRDGPLAALEVPEVPETSAIPVIPGVPGVPATAGDDAHA
ncbi:MarR family winged helix-turn-helix transcriptional regulator [Rhodococcus sp. W8901]|uniref:MarR family winged helix-turn-helix transcriptional regulator n=1 Tax=Rhodococcus sp. W8901 TaxID=2742603 RepID=UPI001581D1BC|nr:MarR family winged helix-turn-helix transcriptional regulator [Rhodococcus sp. W8901]QKT10874.1 winged helix-turn-helix transcriptional regulator [Rhodococcus sp. W8901]